MPHPRYARAAASRPYRRQDHVGARPRVGHIFIWTVSERGRRVMGPAAGADVTGSTASARSPRRRHLEASHDDNGLSGRDLLALDCCSPARRLAADARLVQPKRASRGKSSGRDWARTSSRATGWSGGERCEYNSAFLSVRAEAEVKPFDRPSTTARRVRYDKIHSIVGEYVRGASTCVQRCSLPTKWLQCRSVSPDAVPDAARTAHVHLGANLLDTTLLRQDVRTEPFASREHLQRAGSRTEDTSSTAIPVPAVASRRAVCSS